LLASDGTSAGCAAGGEMGIVISSSVVVRFGEA
jgi:hypothetical protein